jgi:hypothetical protein
MTPAMTSAMLPGKEAKALAELVDEMLRRLGSSSEPTHARKNVAIKTSLFDRCIELCRAGGVPSPDAKIRTLHHLSCTGGTLIAKCLAAMPNTLLLNEVDPYSRMLYNPDSPKFNPTDLASLVRMGDRNASDKVLGELFLGQLRALHGSVVLEGRRLILRDHSHGQFLFTDEPDGKKSLLTLVRPAYPTCSVVTVRDPLDSYLSMRDLDWIHFSPNTVDEYCRRYHLFLDAHAGLPIYRYEEFLEAPQVVMRRLCDQLELPFNETFELTFDAFKFSGDSGRSGGIIAPRPRRAHEPEVEALAGKSSHYLSLCERIGYPALGQAAKRPGKVKTSAKNKKRNK